MTVPSGMERTCRTGRSLNVVIFTKGPPLREKKEAGAAPEGAAPAVINIKEPAEPRRPAAFAAALVVAGLNPVLAMRTRELRMEAS
jgi:hypothetical protein